MTADDESAASYGRWLYAIKVLLSSLSHERELISGSGTGKKYLSI